MQRGVRIREKGAVTAGLHKCRSRATKFPSTKHAKTWRYILEYYVLFFLCVLWNYQEIFGAADFDKPFFQQSAPDIDGHNFLFSGLENKVVLVVNVATN
jgi:hypothetical protein